MPGERTPRPEECVAALCGLDGDVVILTTLRTPVGVANSTSITDCFHDPVDATNTQKRWQNGLYLDRPEEWDDPYRFFRW